MAVITASDGIELHVTTSGEQGKEAVVFLHGFPLTSEMWAETAAGLAQTGRWLSVLPDLRGHGMTAMESKSAAGDPSMAQFARDIAEVLDGLGELRPVVVVGLSMGGYVALEFYRRFRERVRAMVLVDTRAVADTPEGARAREIQAHAVLREGSAASLAESMIPKLFAPETSAEIKERWRRIIAAADPRGVAYALRAMAVRPASTPTLTAITVPTLVVVGEHDQITPPDVARGMHAAIAGSHLEVIGGAGHMPPVERPEEFVECLASFLRALPPLEGRG